jgi:hypothetical protein
VNELAGLFWPIPGELGDFVAVSLGPPSIERGTVEAQ